MLTNRFARGLLFVAVISATVFAPFLVNAGSAATAREEVQSAIDKVTAILNDPSLNSKANKSQRIERLQQVLFPKFDFTEMAKRSLATHWQQRTPQEQEEFTKLFTELVENAYLDDVDSYNGEKIRIVGDKQDNDFAEVNTKIINKKGEEFAVDYKLLRSGADWKIYDVVIEHVSVVNNYRSQFNRVIARSSFADLMQKMRDKQFGSAGAKQT